MGDNEVGAWATRRKCTRFWWKIPKEGDHSEDRGVDVRRRLEWILGRLVGGSGLGWLRIGTSGRFLWARWSTFGLWRQGVTYELASDSRICKSGGVVSVLYSVYKNEIWLMAQSAGPLCTWSQDQCKSAPELFCCCYCEYVADCCY
jgi:hypothetical protein